MSAVALFQAKGTLPEWRLIYDRLLAEATFGDVITYDQLDAVLGRCFTDNRSPLYRARHHLGEMRHRWLDTVPKIGYVVAEPRDHMNIAQRHKRRARRQLSLMVKVADVTDLSRLSPEELGQFDNQAKVNAMLYMVAVHHEQRLIRIEDILRDEGKL